MGTLAIQMAKLSGLEVITTCSPKNSAFVTSLGADKVFDYKSPTVGAEIRRYTNDKLRYVWGTIWEAQAPQFCADALSSSADATLHYSAIVLNTFPRADVKADITLAYTVFGEAFNMYGSFKVPAMPQNLEFAKRWGGAAMRLLEEKRVVPHPIDVRRCLDKIAEGLKESEMGRVSAKKLIYWVNDL